MSNTWFRLYHDVVNDPKVQCLPPHLFKAWINILCLASQHPVRGRCPDAAQVAYSLRTRIARAKSWLRQLYERGLLDCDGDIYSVHNWNNRQFQSDSSNERVRKWRARNVTSNVTHNVTPSVTVTTPDTDTDTDTEEKKGDSASRSSPEATPPPSDDQQAKPNGEYRTTPRQLFETYNAL